MKKLSCVLASILAVMLPASGCAGREPAAEVSQKAPPYTVKMVYLNPYDPPQDLAEVVSAVNKISMEKENVKFDLQPIPGGSWATQMNAMFASGEKLDIALISPGNYSNYVSQGRLIPLDDLLDSYGKDVKAAVNAQSPDYLNACRINDKIYGVPTMRDLAAAYGYCMRKDIADKLGLDESKTYTLPEMEEILKKIKAAYPQMYPAEAKGAGDSFIKELPNWDVLGDGLGVLMNRGQDPVLNVVDLYETSEYADRLAMHHRWYQEGLVLPDLVTNTQNQTALIKAGKLAGFMSNLKPGYDNQIAKQTQMPMVSLTVYGPIATSYYVQYYMYGIAQNSKDTTAAMKMLNLIYGNRDVVNLLSWGIEGVDYVKTGTEGVIDFPSGKTAAKWTLGLNWEMGNEMLGYVFKGDSPDLYQQLQAFNSNAMKSKALGFVFDSTKVKNQVTACTNVVNQYRASLENGVVNPDTELPKFIGALKSNGIQDIVDEKQRQLDAWLKAKSSSAGR